MLFAEGFGWLTDLVKLGLVSPSAVQMESELLPTENQTMYFEYKHEYRKMHL